VVKCHACSIGLADGRIHSLALVATTQARLPRKRQITRGSERMISLQSALDSLRSFL